MLKSSCFQSLFTIGLVALILFHYSATSQASTLKGKSFICKNNNLSDITTEYMTPDTFSIVGHFIETNKVELTLNLNILGWYTLNQDRPSCQIKNAKFTVVQNQQSGLWTGKNLSFIVSADGYIDNFSFSRSLASNETCIVTMNRLKISGSVLPFLHLLLNETIH